MSYRGFGVPGLGVAGVPGLGFPGLGVDGARGPVAGCPGTESFIEHISRYVGQTVTIFTTSGGVSGCGFTGVLFINNPCFVTLNTQQGTAPACPLSGSCCRQFRDRKEVPVYTVGSVCDIPIDKIACFAHTAV